MILLLLSTALAMPEALRPIEAQLTDDPLAAASRIHATLASAPPSWAPHLHRQLGDADGTAEREGALLASPFFLCHA